MNLADLLKSLPPRELNIPRGAIIPYIWDDKKNDYVFLFMVPSHPHFGGTRIQIAKGGIDKGESAETCAMREGKEELGLKKENIVPGTFKELGVFKQVTQKEEFDMTTFYVEVKDKKNFNKPHFETKFTTWTTAERFEQIGRKSHKEVVYALHSKLTET